MLQTKPLLKVDQVASRFSILLNEAGTSLENPTLAETWRAFTAFCREAIACDDERLFFEAGVSTVESDSFYVHFSRTFFGREPKGHIWSYEVICDFLFPLNDALERLSCTVEADELVGSCEERDQFLTEVQAHEKLWQALSGCAMTHAEIYIGES